MKPVAFTVERERLIALAVERGTAPAAARMLTMVKLRLLEVR